MDHEVKYGVRESVRPDPEDIDGDVYDHVNETI